MFLSLSPDWMIGVRAVEIFGLTILAIAAADIAYENCCGGSFGRRTLSERLAPGILSIVGGECSIHMALLFFR